MTWPDNTARHVYAAHRLLSDDAVYFKPLGRGKAVQVDIRGIRGLNGTRCSMGPGELGMIVYLHVSRCTGTT